MKLSSTFSVAIVLDSASVPLSTFFSVVRDSEGVPRLRVASVAVLPVNAHAAKDMNVVRSDTQMTVDEKRNRRDVTY